MNKTITRDDAPHIIAHGAKMAKKRNPVYLLKQETPFCVQSREGLHEGQPGDFVAHDPLTGDVWVVSADYVKQHYEAYEAFMGK